MGIKTTAIAVVSAAVIGYLFGRGDGRDIEAYKSAVNRISQLESDNQHLVSQVDKMRSQNAATSLALSKRVEELNAMRSQAKNNTRSLSNAGNKNADWANGAVPDGIASILRTKSDN